MQNRKGVIAYLLIAFGMAWAPIEIPIRFGGIPYGSHLLKLVWLPIAFAPAVAAFIVRKWITREGFADAGLKLNLQRWPYYIVAWLLPLVGMVCIAILAPLLGVGKPDLSFAGARKFFAEAGKPYYTTHPWMVISALPLAAIFATPILFGEEFGWRSYLQLRLFPDRPVLAAILTGLIWSAWHWPENLRGYNFPDHPLIGGLLVFPVSAVFLSIIFGWLRLKTGSIWCSSLAHAATNTIAAGLFMFLFAGGPSLLFVSYEGILRWIPLGALSAWIVLTGQLKPANEAAGKVQPAYSE